MSEEITDHEEITEYDVFLYFANELDLARRREIEAACATNKEVRDWFYDLAPEW